MTRLDPIATRNEIESSYGRYLRSVMRTNDPGLNEAMRRAWGRMADATPLVAGPILESSPPFEAGRSIRELVEDGTLCQTWLERRMEAALPIDRPLYFHQETAVRHVNGKRRNLVVSTGTGSGKTEAFLIPIIDALLREHEAGTLGPGVRALILYPLNALANDQLKRLRELLHDRPEITFGRYTGDTPGGYQRAAEERRAQGLPPATRNELISRDQMQSTPPHILLTNYAMLEYLLMRPGDSPFFEHDGNGWRFVVLDEVHSYDGALALELGMLLRRLFDRIGRSPDEVCCIGTSATLGSGEKSFPQVASFASKLFGARFEYDAADTARQDVISGRRKARVLPAPDRAMTLDRALALDAAGDRAEALLRIPEAQALLNALVERPTRAESLAASLFPGRSDATEQTTALVESLATHRRAGDDHAILNARYHTFVRAIEGPAVCLRPHAPDGLPRISLVSDRHCPECGEHAPMMELATCRRCNQWYLRGIVSGAREVSFKRADGQFDNLPDVADSPVKYMAPSSGESASDDDEFAESDGDEAAGGAAAAPPADEELVACTYCWQLGESDPGCACPPASRRRFRMALRTHSSKSIRCLNCSATSSMGGPSRLRLGTDAPPAVLASTLYDELNAGGDPDGGKFISFADSRQDAAFFAVYLERTYAKVSRRRLILEALRHNWRVEGGPVAMEDVAKELRTLAEQAGFFDVRMSTVERRRTVMGWLTAEMTAMDRRQSLEGVGLAVRRLRRPANWKAPAEMRAFPWEFDDDEAWTVIETLMLTLVDAQVMTFPEGVDHADAIFAPRNRPSFVREASSHAPSGTAAWLPASPSARNRRTDYLIRVLSQKGIGDLGGTRVAAVNLLQFIWQGITRPGALLAPYMVATNDQKTGTRYQPDYAFWEWEEPSDGLLKCSHCGLRAGRSVLGVCPAMRCQGTMEPHRPDEDDHYRFTYQSAGGGSMRVEEHTAQWTARQAAEIQQRFLDGDVDVLSCSTTFELGVDVGDLQTVFLRNIPPAAANYVQRAGRAGRRRDAVAFVLSYAQLRPHDQHIFRIADDLVAGRVPVPRVPAANERVVRRHVHSVALSRFFRTVLPPGSDRWTNVGRFFIENDGEALEQFREWLRRREPELQAELARVVPQDVQNDLGVSSWEWAEALLDPDSPLGRAEGDVADDEATFGRLMTEAAEAKDFRRAGYYKSVLNSVHSQYLLGFLAARNVLPKYGFPVDVVALKTNHLQAKEATQLDLDRDLRVAISEFAPGAGVVAAKKLWVSAGVRLLPNRALPLRDYVRCDSCHRIELDQETRGACPLCGGDVRKDLPMIEPMYGFVAGEPDARSLGDERPLRLFASDVHFVRHHKDTPQARQVLVEAGPGDPALLGRYARHAELAVINTGRRRGFQFCERCGFARLASLMPPRRKTAPRHDDPESRRPCGNTQLQRVALGHKFSTDVVEFVLPGFLPHGEPPEQLSHRVGVLSAIAEGAARSLHIRREDLDTTFYIEGGNTVFVLYDSVPGGAGLAREIFADAGDVIAAALDVVGRCECGADSSCYGCIRTYRNQQQHDALNRGLVADALQPVVDAAFASPPYGSGRAAW